MHRWSNVSHQDCTSRFQKLSQYLNSLQLINEYVPQSIKPEEFINSSEISFKGLNSVRLDPIIGEQMLDKFNSLSVAMMQNRVCDLLVNRKNVWWPESVITQALPRLIVNEIKDLQLQAGALIIGSGALARAAMIACIRSGFMRIGLCDQNEASSVALVNAFKKVVLEMKIEFVSENVLMSLPGIYGLVINTIPDTSADSMVTQLTYFNYLRSDGAVIDFNESDADTLLLTEARGLGFRVSPGRCITAYNDIAWAETIFGQKLKVDSFLNSK